MTTFVLYFVCRNTGLQFTTAQCNIKPPACKYEAELRLLRFSFAHCAKNNDGILLNIEAQENGHLKHWRVYQEVCVFKNHLNVSWIPSTDTASSFFLPWNIILYTHLLKYFMKKSVSLNKNTYLDIFCSSASNLLSSWQILFEDFVTIQSFL